MVGVSCVLAILRTDAKSLEFQKSYLMVSRLGSPSESYVGQSVEFVVFYFEEKFIEKDKVSKSSWEVGALL
jgi:hypothetical protein